MARQNKMRTQRFSLSVRVSAILVLAAVLPLIITVSFIELLSRPTLISQASQEMLTDAQTRASLIDSYFSERVLEAESLSRLAAIQGFLVGDETLRAKAYDGLATGHGRGSHYEDWSLFDLQGNLKMFYPFAPQKHGQYYILPEARQQLLTSRQAVFSSIFYNSASNEDYIDIYTPVVTVSYKPAGILRTSFDLSYIWTIVNNEAGANGAGSYAFILDQNGVRIAYTNPNPDPAGLTNSPHLLKAIAPLSPAVAQQVNSEDLYGRGDSNVPILADDKLASILQSTSAPATFQMTPAEQQQAFQVARSTTFTVPWTYFVLSPLSTVTAIADQQLFIIVAVTFLVLVLAGLLGLGIGRRITQPILRSVDSLLGSSQSLKALAAAQQSAAGEQTWVVEASQVGLNKVEYYSNATNVAAQRLSSVGSELKESWQYLDSRRTEQVLGEIVSAAKYIEKARTFQDESNKSLAAAIRVTTQVSEQLTSSATSASEAAEQLEEVVNQLRAVVGK